MTYAKKTLSEIKLIHGNYGNFIKGQKLPKDKEKKYKTPPYQDLAASNEIDGELLNEKCWPGYEKKGMKTMFGKRYPNCVKKKKTRKEEYSDWRSELENIQEVELPKFPKKETDKAGGSSKSFNKKPKSRMSALDKNVFSKIYNKSGTTKVTDYTMVPDKFKTGKNFERMGGVSGFANRRFTTKPTKINKPVMSVGNFASKNMRGFSKASMKKGGLISKVGKGAVNVLSKMGPKGRLAAAAITGLALGAKPIANKLKEIGKKRRDAAIDRQVDKYVADRKGPIRKVNYMPDNMYTVKRDKDGKVTGTGDQIRVVPGTRTIKRMPKPGERTSIKSRFSQNTRMKLGNYGSLSPMDEKMDLKKADMGDVITDFRKSDAPQFKGKSDKKIQKMAIAAKLEADGKSLKDEYLPEILDKKDVPHVKKLVKKLRDGSKTHAKQADELEVAMKTENTAIESELLIQDWNKDDIKFTEIETVDIIKAKPLKENKFFDFIRNIGKSDVNKEIKSLKNRFGPPPDSVKKEIDEYEPDMRGIKDKNKKKKKFPIVKVKSLKDFEKEAMRVRTEQKSNWRDELEEDWQKVNRKDKTDGLSRKAVKAYRRENPGSKLQTAVTKDPKKLKKGSKSAKRRLSFCRRMKGMKKKLTSAKTRRDPDSRINKALRRWNC